ncbi:MAG TPA: hypothetical protein VHE09_11260 [Rhizomicrobium sp.]|nr:hypothetical protein [Rhizomicrobium sp.]
MSRILITPLSALPGAMAEHGPSHIVSLLSSGYMIDTPKGFPADRHLRLSMHDIVDEGMPESPHRAHVDRLIAFGRAWDASAPMIVHCWAGISRSTAATYTILNDRAGPGAEDEIAQMLRARAPHAQPNKLIVRLADEALGRGGAMVRAIDRIGSGTLSTEGVTFEMPLSRI